MAGKPNIRWSPKDEANLSRTIRNFNAKLRRLKKANPSKAEFYPDTISIKDVRNRVKTRQDFNREVNRISRFSRRGSEQLVTTDAGLTATKYEIREASIMRRVVNLKRKREAERLGLTVEAGLKTQVEKQSLTPKRDVQKVKQTDFKSYVESLEKEIASTFDEEKREAYIENYYKGLFNTLGEKAFEIMELIQDLPDEVIVNESISNPFLVIEFMYDPLGEDVKADQLYNDWAEVVDNYYSESL